MRTHFFNLRKLLSISILLTGFLWFTSFQAKAQCPQESDLIVSFTDITCNGFDDGTITLEFTDLNGYSGDINYAILRNASVGVPPALFTVTTSDLTVTFTDLIPANYTIILTPIGGCDPVLPPDLVSLSEPPELIATLDNVIPACTPGTGSIDITVSGGNGGYNYAWSGPTDPGNVEDPTGLDAGVYSVTVTDAKSCLVEILDIFVPVITTADAGPDQVVCENFATLAGNDYRIPGEIGTWLVISGSGTFTDPNDPLTTVTNLGVGTNVFEWFITDDANICPGTRDQVSITWNNLQLVSPGDILLNCNGIADGSGSFNVTGGAAPFVFTVDQNTTGATTTPNATSLDFTGAGPGVIEVTITDADGCSQTELITITEPAPITIEATASTDITCFGGSDGTITITASGGTGALSYTVLPSGITNATGAFTGLAPGDYTVEVTDVNGCGPVSTAAITLLDGPEILIDNVASTDVGCSGTADGTITVTASGGTAPLSYTIQPLNVTNATGVFNGLATGDYTVDVADANACGPVTTATITISDPPVPGVDNIDVTPITCFGADDGVIALTVSGGAAPLTYTINPGGASNNSGTFTGLAPGDYTIDIQESNGCPPISTGTITVTEPAEITIASTAFTNPLCFGAPEGTITVVAAGGTGGLTYTIQPLGVSNTTGLFMGLIAGVYTVEVTDANNCGPFTTAPIVITDPAEIVIDTVTPTDISCTGGTNGSIEVVASGGTGALSYTLQPGAVSNASGIFNNLAAGTYTVEITDANGCGPVSTSDIDINEQTLNLPVTDAVSCAPAQSDIVITVSGTTAGLTYELQTTTGASLTPPVTAVSSGGDLDLIILQANAPAATTTYQVAAQIPGCGDLINANQPTVTVTPSPDVTLAVSDATACSPGSDPAVFVIAGSEIGVTYELQDLGGNSLTPPVTVPGNGADALLTLPVAQLPGANTTYQVAADNGAGCTAVLNDQPSLTIIPGPTAAFQGDVTICEGTTADLLVDLTGTGPWDITYSDGAAEITITSNVTPAVISVSPSATQSYDLVRVTDNSTGCTTEPISSSATVNVDPVSGDQISFGVGEWIGYVYDDGPTGPPYPGRVDFDPAKYRGFINQPENFDLDLNNSIPLTGPDLCGSYSDNYSIRFKLRKDFAPGAYQITVGADDGYRLSLDGGVTFLVDEWQDQSYTSTTFNLCLDGNVDLVLEYYENGGISRVSFDATLITPAADVDVTIAADQLPACSGTTTTFTATPVNAGANPTFQWQVNGVDVPGETNDTFTTSTLNNGDNVQVVVTASAAVICATNNPATSNALTYSAVTELTADVTVTPDQDPACIGTPITFTANPINGGANPTYQW